jgi:hypothetical protein
MRATSVSWMAMPNWEAHAEAIANSYTSPHVGRSSAIRDVTAVATLLKALAAGNFLCTAAHLAGLSKQTVYNWIKRGEAGEHPYDRFVDAYQKASAVAEVAAVAAIRAAGAAGPEYWLASQTFLERRFPERWARRSQDETAPVIVVRPTHEALAAVERQVHVLKATAQAADPRVSPPADSPIDFRPPVSR